MRPSTTTSLIRSVRIVDLTHNSNCQSGGNSLRTICLHTFCLLLIYSIFIYLFSRPQLGCHRTSSDWQLSNRYEEQTKIWKRWRNEVLLAIEGETGRIKICERKSIPEVENRELISSSSFECITKRWISGHNSQIPNSVSQFFSAEQCAISLVTRLTTTTTAAAADCASCVPSESCSGVNENLFVGRKCLSSWKS